MADSTVDIRGVEVLSPGIWNGIPISRRDLEDMVAAFEATADSLPVNVRLGHDARQAFARAVFGARAGSAAARDEHGWPALGWATRLYLKGDLLLADLSGVPVRLAAWIKEQRYRTRSGGLRFNRSVGGTVYRWMLDHIALLGADTPAVDGLADIGLADTDVDRLVELHYEATDADGWLNLGDASGATSEPAADAETSLERFVAALKALFGEYSPLIYNRTGAPRVRQLFAALEADLRRVARTEVPLHQEDEAMTQLTVEAIRGLLNLAADAPLVDVARALNGADDAEVDALVTLAATAMQFDSPEQLVGWLAGALAVAPGDLGGIAAKVVELMGGQTPEDPSTDPTAPPDPNAPIGGNMSVNTATQAATTPANVELSAAYVELAARTQRLEEELVLRDARLKVEADARARSLALPKPVFDTLVNLSVSGDKAGYDAILGNVRSVPATEKGTAGNGEETVDLSAIELHFAAMHGVTPEQMKAQKLADAGVKRGI